MHIICHHRVEVNNYYSYYNGFAIKSNNYKVIMIDLFIMGQQLLEKGELAFKCIRELQWRIHTLLVFIYL